MKETKSDFIGRLLSHEFNGARVAIIGSAGVGKTSLLEALFEQEPISSRYAKISEQVRVLCAERGYTSPYDIKEDVHLFRWDLLQRQIELENSFDSFIADRSVIDAWVYFMRWSWNSVDVDFAERYYQAAYEQAQKYDQLIYLPISFPIVEDGFRWANPTYQKQIDRLIVSTVNDWGLGSKLYEIKSLSVEDRLQEINNITR